MKLTSHRPQGAVVALSCAVLLCVADARAANGPPQTPADDSLPSGLVVVIENKAARELDLRALNNPYVRGVALQIRWRDIEPEEGKPDWSRLDQVFAAAESSKKWVQLLLFAGLFSPAWALQGARTESFRVQYGPGAGTPENLPMPWDTVYLNRWFAFVKQLSERYGKNPAFRVAAAAGPTSVSAEFTLPNRPEDIQKWISLGYTPSKYIEAWRKTFQEYAAAFPNQYVSLSCGSSLNINDLGKRDPRARRPTKEAVINEGIRILGRRFALQDSNLDGNPEKQFGPHNVPLVIGYNGRIVTGFQLRTSCLHNSGNMGAEGNPPLALKKSIDRGMAPNAAGRHATYLEIYAPDVLADEMQPVLRDAAALFP